MKALRRVAAAMLIAIAPCAFAAPMVYNDRVSFADAAGALLTDDYEDPGYSEWQNDEQMNSVKGWTRYTPTAFNDVNFVFEGRAGMHIYCAGCNGSFELDFTADSLGGSGVHAVGFDYLNQVFDASVPFVAYVSFASGQTINFALQQQDYWDVPLPHFFGLTSLDAITSIHIGLADGFASADGTFAIDNLSVSPTTPIPEPSTYAILAAGLGMIALSRRLRKPMLQ